MSLAVKYSTKMFFDRKAVLNAVDRAERRSLSRTGAFIRRRARSSLRRRKKVAGPGSPPSVHSSDKFATLKNIQFAYEPKNRGVVVGPVKLNQVEVVNGSRSTVPELHEFGGTSSISEIRYGDHWFRLDKRRTVRPWQKTRVRQARYKARPYMGPALDAEIDKGTIADVWQDSMRAA